jgi:hypothetical protein
MLRIDQPSEPMPRSRAHTSSSGHLRMNGRSRAPVIPGAIVCDYEASVEAACEAWRKLMAQPDTTTSIGLRDWARIDQR